MAKMMVAPRTLPANWHGHYWVEGVTPDGIAFVADLTADQFGYAHVYFDWADPSRSR
jgi:hypothetical protein